MAPTPTCYIYIYDRQCYSTWATNTKCKLTANFAQLLNSSIARVWCLYLHFTINQSQFLLCIPISNVPIIYKYDRSPSNNIGPHSHPQRNKYKRLHVPIEETVKFDHCIYITFFFNSLLLLFLPHSQIIIQACSCFNQSSKQEFLTLSLSFPFFLLWVMLLWYGILVILLRLS